LGPLQQDVQLRHLLLVVVLLSAAVFLLYPDQFMELRAFLT